MSKLWKSVWVLGATVLLGLGMSGVVLGATGTGPYYATPSWDQKLPSDTRFIVLTNWNSEAVLDRETGLVWEQSPSTATYDWFNASVHCVRLSKGGRKGWRLPTIQDLASLIDPTQSNPSLPSGHPFTVHVGYWSATGIASSLNPDSAWIVFFSNGFVGFSLKSIDIFLAWCVRGGPGVDPQ